MRIKFSDAGWPTKAFEAVKAALPDQAGEIWERWMYSCFYGVDQRYRPQMFVFFEPLSDEDFEDVGSKLAAETRAEVQEKGYALLHERPRSRQSPPGMH